MQNQIVYYNILLYCPAENQHRILHLLAGLYVSWNYFL